MTPFGAKLRELREARGVSLADMASELGISSAYLSALEHGKRGRPSWYLIQRIIAFFNIIWDDAEQLQELARISHPRVTIDTAGLDPRATELANRLAAAVKDLDSAQLDDLIGILDRVKRREGGA